MSGPRVSLRCFTALIFLVSISMQAQIAARQPAATGQQNAGTPASYGAIPSTARTAPMGTAPADTTTPKAQTLQDASLSAAMQARHRAAVLNFNHAKVVNSVLSAFGTEQNLGQYFADLLANRLTADNVMRVVDRNGVNKAMLDPPLPVQDPKPEDTSFRSPGSLMNLGGRPDDNRMLTPQTYSKVGTILGVDSLIKYFEADAVVIGEIVDFGREDERTKGVMDRLRSGINGGCNKSHAVVTVNARMVDLNKGELIASTRLTAVSHRASCNLLQAPGFVRPVTSLNDNNFPMTPLGDALNQVAYMVAQVLEASSQQIPVFNPTQVYGKIADIAGEDVTINIGSVAGVHLGDVLVISHVSRVIRDPESNKPIRTVEDMVGQMNITSVTPFYAVGRFTGRGTPSLNDIVRSLNQ